MASTTLNRPNNSADPRANRYGDYNTTIGHGGINNSQNASNGQGNSQTNPWKTNNGIWGTGAAIGSGYTSNRRDVPRSQYADEDVLHGPTGSSALSASSEADPWSVRSTGSWKINSSGPNSGETSPSNHRGSDASVSASSGLSESQKSSPYLVNTSRPNAGQGYGNRGPVKSNLDPSTGSFKYSYATNVSVGDNKENGQSPPMNGASADKYTGSADRRLAAAYRASQAKMSELSFTSSKVSGNAPGSMIFHDNPYTANSNSLQNCENVQRQSSYGRNPQMAPHNNARPIPGRRGYSNDPPQYASGPDDENFHSPVTESPLASYITSALQYSSAMAQESAHCNSYARSRASDSSQASQLSNPRNPGYNYNTASPNSMDMPTNRAQQAQNYSDLDGSLQRLTLGQQQQVFYANQLFNHQFQGQYPPQAAWEYTYPVRPLSQTFHHYPVNPLHNFSSISIPRGPSRDTDLGHGVRSPLLEEFRNNTKSNTRRYEIKDIYGFVVEFSGDQHGSRFIQQKLETANSDEKEWVFREILPNALQLMTDVFGNYVVQKCFEHGSQVQKRCLGELMRGRVMELSLQMYGCRVVQKALEHVLADQQAALVQELKVDVLRCVKDQNGNHVIQKAIERCPKEHVQFILDAFRGNVHTLATHPYGCRVIQRMLEYCSPEDQASILDELFVCAQMLIIDQYGNYVVQHVIQHGKPEHRAALIKLVTLQLHALSKHKFASNVVERSFVCGTEEEREAMVRLITEPSTDGSSPLHLMMKDQYGNYVIQKILTHLSGTQREAFVEHVKPHFAALRKFNAGKQLAAIEKLIFVAPLGPQPHRFDGCHGMHFGDIKSAAVTPTTATTTPNLTMSTTPTPKLTTEANSPQSSNMPSAALGSAGGIHGSVEREVVGGKSGDGIPTLEIRVEQV